MYTGYIVKAGEACKDERIAKAIKNFKYENIHIWDAEKHRR